MSLAVSVRRDLISTIARPPTRSESEVGKKKRSTPLYSERWYDTYIILLGERDYTARVARGLVIM